MAFVLKDRVKESTTSAGTGAISLGGAAATFDTFQSVLTDGATTYYAIVHTASGVDEWEVGLGTWNTGNDLTRTTVLSGSNGASAVDFSAGIKDVFMTYPASIAAYTDASGDLSGDIGLGNHSTTEIVEGSNLYYTDARVDAHLSGGTGVTYNAGAISIGQDVATTADVTFNTVTLAGDPTTALEAATKEYVDTIAAAGIHYHDPVRVEAPSNLTATYDNGTSGVGATLTNSGTQAAINIDGVALNVADRVLVYNQTNPAHNGIYTVTTVGSGSTNWVLTRATDADSYGVSDKDAMGEGDAYFVKEGDTGAGELYVMNTAGVITFGTTPISFTVIAETAIYSAGTGLTLTGTTFATEQDIATTASPTFNTVTADLVGDTSGTHTGAVVGNVTGDLTGNADTATALETSRTIQLTGDVIGSATFNGTANATITATVQDDSHAHVISNVDGLQAALDAKTPTSRSITAGNGLTGGGALSANLTLNVGAGSGITVQADTVSHADTSSQASVNGSGRTYIQDVTLDGFGHVTGLTTATETVTDTTYSAGAGLTLTGTTFSHTDTSAQGSVNNSGATVIQDVTLDTYGHVTGLASKALTYTDVGAQVAGTYNTIIGTDSDLNTSGSTIIDNIYVTDGVITSMGTRTLTLADLGYTGATNANYITNNNQLTNGAGYITSSGSITGNAGSVDGYSVSTTRNAANTIPVRNGSGYLDLGWINTTSGDTTSALSRVYVDTGDNYIRKCTLAHLASQGGFAGDITNVTAGTNLTGGGSSGSVTLNVTASPTFTTVTATTFNTTSDINTKKDITPITGALSKVQQLGGYNFTFKHNEEKSSGVIAQEVQKVLPELVQEGSEGHLTVQYGNMVGLLIEAIKEQQVQIEELKEAIKQR